MKLFVAQSCPTLCRPMSYRLPGSSVHGISQQEYWSGLPFPSPGIFPTQGSNLGLLHCRQNFFAVWATREYTEELYKRGLNDLDNHDGVIIHLELDILKCEVKWALGSIAASKVSGCDGVLAELFKILKDGASKVLHSICLQIWKTQQWPQD